MGLSCAYALANRKIRTLLISDSRPGEASPAAAGMLAPQVEHGKGDPLAQQFSLAARDLYPTWVEALGEQTGISIGLLRNGILQLAPDDQSAELLRGKAGGKSQWLDGDALHLLEPSLARVPGALLHGDDGAVDNVALLEALRQAILSSHSSRVIESEVVEIRARRPHPAVITGTSRYEVSHIVLAAGAWSGSVGGVPRALPLEPIRGQMLMLDGAPIEHVVYGPGAYIVPRQGTTLAGSTMEHAGFEVATTQSALEDISSAAASFAPPLAKLVVRRSWCGLRPVTPDSLPIIGRDPEFESLIYACGHSRNGILLAPLTGECIASMIAGETAAHDLTPFSVERFSSTPSITPPA